MGSTARLISSRCDCLVRQTTPIHCLVVRWLAVLAILFAAQTAHAQTLSEAAAAAGITFGSLASDGRVGETGYDRRLINHTNMITMTTYWKWSTQKDSRDEITFDQSERIAQFAERNGKRIHGHPLLWASDEFIPDWVFAYDPQSDGRAIMEEHIDAVAGYYRGRVEVWDVVNEALTYQGELRDNFWRRAMGDQFLNIAFARARAAAPNAILLYNDYEIESNAAKFQGLVDMLQRLQRQGAPIDGVGWQMHTDIDTVLDSNFPLLSRMNEVAALGLKNYITELDIRIPSNSQANLELQKQAYKKVAQLFMRANNRGAIQTWDLADPDTWLTPFTGTKQWPLLFDDEFKKKPAFFGLLEAFQEGAPDVPDTAGPVRGGVYRLKVANSGLYLHQSDNKRAARLQGYDGNPQWWSQLWQLEYVAQNIYRLRCLWGDNYIAMPSKRAGQVARVYPFDRQDQRQLFRVKPTGDGYFRLQNVGTNTYLKIAGKSSGVPIIGFPLRPSWKSEKWSLEFVR